MIKFPFVDELLNLVFPLPRECPLCRAPGPPEVCPACRAGLERQRQAGYCRRCGRFTPALPASGSGAFAPGAGPAAKTPAGSTAKKPARGAQAKATCPSVKTPDGATAHMPAGGMGQETGGTPGAACGRSFLCPECARRNRPFPLVRAAGLYDGPLKEAVHRFKYAGRRSLAAPLAGLLAEVLAGPDFTPAGFPCAKEAACSAGGAQPLTGGGWAIVPVPLSPGRLRERGFNQAALLARQLARRLDLPLMERALVKRRETAPQVGLSHRDREKNLSDAFAAAQNAALPGKNVLLIDDVFTTGSTISAAADILLRAGAGQVYGLVLAAGRFI